MPLTCKQGQALQNSGYSGIWILRILDTQESGLYIVNMQVKPSNFQYPSIFDDFFFSSLRNFVIPLEYRKYNVLENSGKYEISGKAYF